jgi:transglutaminase-like putative cysteine protease
VDRPLGNPYLLTGLVLEVQGGEQFLVDGPNQRIVRDAATGRRTLELGPNDTDWPLAWKERDRYLAETADYPTRHPQVVALAHEAIGDAVTDEDMVRALVRFVRGYLEYERDARNPSVLEIIESRRGDCSEHANLLVTLARTVGIPARRVSGLALAGDRQFGMHAWVEVAVKDNWIAVDPTCGSCRLHPAYVRFDPAADNLTDPNLRLRFVSAQRLPLRLVDYSNDWDMEFRLTYQNLTWFFLIAANALIARRKGRRWLLWLLLSIPLAPLVTLILICLKRPEKEPAKTEELCEVAG